MTITIFDVGHGACALVSSETGQHALIDCGHNANTGWRPSVALPSMSIRRLSKLFITNCDEDHVSDLFNLRRHVQIDTLYRNRTVSGASLLGLKMQDSLPGPGIFDLIRMTQEYTTEVTFDPGWPDIAFSSYCNRYPQDFCDENNLSMAAFVHHRNVSVLFPGDLEEAGWRNLLRNPQFRSELSRVSILVASHHGRESGCCDELFDTGWRPEIVIISDDCIRYETQEVTDWYRERSTGVLFPGYRRHVLTTRSDGDIFIMADGMRATSTNSRQRTD